MQTQTWFYTRLGIGVFDPQWWEYRIRLFAATTLPSIARFCQHGARWAIVVDRDMDPSMLIRFRKLISDAGIESQVEFVPVRFYFNMPEALRRTISKNHGPDEHVGVIRIDDDDALGEAFLERAYGSLGGDAPALVTIARGWEVDLANRKMRPRVKEFGSMNTLFWGPVNMVADYANAGHHRVKDWAKENRVKVVKDRGNGREYLYVRHKQTDSSFAGRRNAIRDDPATRNITQVNYARFGLNVEALANWREFAQTAPSTANTKTWDRAAAVVEDAKRLHSADQLEAKKSQLMQLTSDVLISR